MSRHMALFAFLPAQNVIHGTNAAKKAKYKLFRMIKYLSVNLTPNLSAQTPLSERPTLALYRLH